MNTVELTSISAIRPTTTLSAQDDHVVSTQICEIVAYMLDRVDNVTDGDGWVTVTATPDKVTIHGHASQGFLANQLIDMICGWNEERIAEQHGMMCHAAFMHGILAN